MYKQFASSGWRSYIWWVRELLLSYVQPTKAIFLLPAIIHSGPVFWYVLSTYNLSMLWGFLDYSRKGKEWGWEFFWFSFFFSFRCCSVLKVQKSCNSCESLYPLLRVFWLLLPKFNFWKGERELGYVATQIWDFYNIS